MCVKQQTTFFWWAYKQSMFKRNRKV